jgi:hypothetical protein
MRQPGQLGLHRNGQRRQGGRTDRLQELPTAGEMPVRRVGDDAGARLVASRSTTASGPPARANWIPASSSARRRSPWR